ncbi:MAG: DMT family transporter [Dongiaceae bacterium]
MAAPPAATRSQGARAILAILGAGVVFTAHDVLMKLSSGAYPVTELLVLRSLAAYLPLLVLLHLDGGLGGLRSRRLRLHLLRTLLLFLTFSAYYVALAAIPLSEAAPLYYAAPLYIAALSGPLLGERVGAGRWAAVIAGLVGVVAICRPGAALFEPAALLAAASAVFYALAQLMARSLGRTERAATMAFFQNTTNLLGAAVVAVLIGGAGSGGLEHPSLRFLTRPWSVPSPADGLLIFATGLLAALGSWSLTQGYRLGSPHLVAPFEYGAVVLAMIAGVLIWDERLTASMVIGAVLVVGAGLMLLRAGPGKAHDV